VPLTTPTLTVEDVHRHVHERCFAASGPNGLVGVELEWLIVHAAAPGGYVDLTTLEGAVGRGPRLPSQGRITYEPGGQLELSSLPRGTVAEACGNAAGDAAALATAVSNEGLALVGLGLDPARAPRRVIAGGRYAAMEVFFDRTGPEGRRMMCSTASIQVNVGLGAGPVVERRWRLAHLLGPTLAASFANSPLMHGVPSGWQSARLATWRSLDQTRQGPVPQDAGPAAAWARYALDARVMLIRDGEGGFTPILDPFPFERWITEGHELGYPTEDDFAYHLTTLFPFVRPRGWLEMRMFDALPDPWWRVPIALTAALLFDDEAGEAARLAAAPAQGMWGAAARHGLSHPVLARAARALFTVALEALPSVGTDQLTASTVADFFHRYVDRGRTPADDRLQAWADHGSMHPVDHTIASLGEATWI
jgi:glutamate--cysteine ligase